MSEGPRYLVRNREMVSRLLGIQELRLVVKTQLFGGTVVAACPSPYPSQRVGPYDVCVMMDLVYVRVNLGTVAYAPPKALANIQNTRRHNIGAMIERIWNIARKIFHSPFSFRWRLIRTRYTA